MKRFYSFLLTLVFAIGGMAPAFAAGGQYGNLSGTVADLATKAPIANAAVTATSESGTYHATTDAHGFFSMLGLLADSYTISVVASGYEPVSEPGVAVFGDENNTIGVVPLNKQLKEIGSVRSRSVSGAFQPNQTTDSYTVNAQRILQSTGKAASTNLNDVVLAVPGVTLTDAGTPTIRGGANVEVGYQYDGVRFTEPFLSGNGSNGLYSGLGSVQVVEGAGDATQGGVGSGVINVIPKRGTYPGTLFVDAEAMGPGFSHQLDVEWGTATKDGHFSNYIYYNGQRLVPYYGYANTPREPYLNYFGTDYQKNNQFSDNMILRFGHNQHESLQMLYTNLNQLQYTTGGPGGVFDPVTNPNALVYYPYDTLTQTGLMGPFTPAQYAQVIGLGPGVPATNVAVPGPQLASDLETRFLKFEYDNNLNPTTYLALKYYNWEQLSTADNQYSVGPASFNFPATGWSSVGGSTSGLNLDLTHQIGEKLTVNFNAQYNWLRPQFDLFEPQLNIIGLGNSSTSASDWLTGGPVFNYFCPGSALPPGSLCPNAPRIPSWGIGYAQSLFQQWGTGLRLQFQATDKLKFDIGERVEGEHQHWRSQIEALGFAPPNGINPYDVTPSSWTDASLNPVVSQPRAAVSYQISPRDAVRFGYGRSAIFNNAQTAGTPFHDYGLENYVKVPAVAGSMCGNPAFPQWPCRNYAEQLYWAGDDLEAPDAGNGTPAIYSNFDLSFSHQFRNGMGLKLTGFYKHGSNLPSYILLNQVLGIFAVSNQGFNRTTGAEFNFTTAEHPRGFTGFLSMTYQNVLGTTPPLVSGETAVPSLSTATLALGNVYRAGYVSPFSARAGGTYHFGKDAINGWFFTPVMQYDRGYPYSAGDLIAATVNGLNANVPQVDFGGGVTQLTGVQGTRGGSVSTNYYDPSFPGTTLAPNISATRGVQSGPNTGAYLSHYNLAFNFTTEYRKKGWTLGLQALNLFGNAFNGTVPTINPFYQPVATGLSGPQTNYNTCANPTAFGGGFGSARGCTPFVPRDTWAYNNGAYLLSNGNFTGTPIIGPQRPTTLTIYLQRSI